MEYDEILNILDYEDIPSDYNEITDTESDYEENPSDQNVFDEVFQNELSQLDQVLQDPVDLLDAEANEPGTSFSDMPGPSRATGADLPTVSDATPASGGRRNRTTGADLLTVSDVTPATGGRRNRTTGADLLTVSDATPATGGVPVPSAKQKKAKPPAPEPEPIRKWKKRPDRPTVSDYVHPQGANEDMFVACDTATDIFLVLIQPIVENIIFQTNLYATQRNKILNMTENELLSFIGINFLMGYVKLPSWRHYWCNAEDFSVTCVSKAMSRNRFDSILSNLHVNDNTNMPRANVEGHKDKLFKLPPMIQSLNDQFDRAFHGSRELSIDESMIPFKGRSSMKQYNPMKPVKRGYKLWCMCDQAGYTKRFDVYQGKDSELEEEFAGFGLGERIVLSLSKSEWGKSRVLFFDNYFTSLKLLERLKIESTLACGTIRSNRKGLPDNLLADNKLARGEFDYRISAQGIGVYKWKDTKAVFLASNFHGYEIASVLRTEKTGKKVRVPCPTVVEQYNMKMGGVDHADRLRMLYCVDRKSRKWWHRLFFGMLDIAFVNSYVIYCELIEKVPLLEYRRMLAKGLMIKNTIGAATSRRNSNEGGKGRNAGTSKRLLNTSLVPNKRRKFDYSVPKDMRLGNRGCHWVQFVKSRGRCEYCSRMDVESRPHSKCSTCGIFLCVNEKKNCFALFHEINVE